MFVTDPKIIQDSDFISKKKSLLLLEDHHLIAQVMRIQFEGQYDIFHATNAENLQDLLQFRTHYDALLFDNDVPKTPADQFATNNVGRDTLIELLESGFDHLTILHTTKTPNELGVVEMMQRYNTEDNFRFTYVAKNSKNNINRLRYFLLS